jgi:predicted GIY-YIG superfamily endonuclease
MATSPQRTVYVLKNTDTPPRYYIGRTSDLAGRLVVHNKGGCPHTAKHRPWYIDFIAKFADERRAVRFEKYLKSGSGVEFARRHLR